MSRRRHLPASGFPRGRRTATAVLALAALVLTGCSAGHDTGGAGSSASPTTAGALPSDSPAATGPRAFPTSLDDWPTYPATEAHIPIGVKSKVIAKGYTGQTFLGRLVADWHITLGNRKKLTSSEPVWFVGGEGHPTKGSELQVSAMWAPSGDLRSLHCSATANAPRYEDFLRACLGLDHPGSDAKAAVTWLERVKPRVDKVFAEEQAPREPITSPLLRSSTTATYLRKGANGAYSPSGTYELETYGADAG